MPSSAERQISAGRWLQWWGISKSKDIIPPYSGIAGKGLLETGN